MNKKKEIKNRTMLKLVQGLTGAVFAVSAFMLPVTGFAEEAVATPKYVMPQEQVYLDPSQVAKAALSLLGQMRATVRLPLAEASDQTKELMQKVLQDLWK